MSYYYVVVIFLIIASLVAIGTIIYVIIDWLLERRKKEEVEEVCEEVPEPIIIPEPIIVPEPVIVPEPIVILDEVDAIEADALISDDVAMQYVIRERGAGQGRKGEINLGVINEHFEAGEVITLALLQQRKLVSKKERRIKILADGILTKPFTIKAEAFSKEAIKMIELTGGTVIELY